jgi:hypothetical protein
MNKHINITKKILIILVLCNLFLMVFIPTAYASSDNIEEDTNTLRESAYKAIEDEKGTMFEKILAKMIVSVGVGIRNFGFTILDFKDLDTLIFNKGVENPEILFGQEWNDTMNFWFKTMQKLILPLILIAVVVTGLRFVKASTNPRAREDAIKATERLFFSCIILLFVPIFINTMLKINNYLVSSISLLISDLADNGSLEDSMGLSGNMIENLKTGSPLLTAVVILMFAGIEFRLNIMFFMRMFSITVLYIFTPFVAALWAIEKTVNAAGIWIGEMISNIFMQFAYAFVFMVFLAFAPYMGTGGTIISVMIIISVAEMLRNSVQNLWIRLSGLDEAGASLKATGVLGGIAALPNLGRTVAAQFGGMGKTKEILGRFRGGSGSGISSAGIGETGIGEALAGASTATTASSPISGQGSHTPLMGGSVSNARANAVTGLGAVQTMSNMTQTAVQATATLATLPLGASGQKLASSIGNLAGMGVRAVGAPVATGISAMATSMKRGEGLKGTGRAYKEAIGVQGDGLKSNLKTAWRTADVIGKATFGGLNSAAQAVGQYGVDPLDTMRP